MVKNGASPSLLTNEWCAIQWRFIIEKISSFSRLVYMNADRSSFKAVVARLFSFEFVSTQLIYRFQKELLGRGRSAIRQIYEKDCDPSQWLLLYVCDIFLRSEETWIELSDGWYSLECQLDKDIQDLVKKNKIFLGQKLHLVGSQVSCISKRVVLRATGGHLSH